MALEASRRIFIIFLVGETRTSLNTLGALTLFGQLQARTFTVFGQKQPIHVGLDGFDLGPNKGGLSSREKVRLFISKPTINSPKKTQCNLL